MLGFLPISVKFHDSTDHNFMAFNVLVIVCHLSVICIPTSFYLAELVILSASSRVSGDDVSLI